MMQQDKILQLKLNSAKVFIKEKRFELARMILEATNHPDADRLMTYVEGEKIHKASKQPILVYFSIAILCLILGVSGGFFLGASQNQGNAGLPQTANSDSDLDLMLIPTSTENPELIASATGVVETMSALDILIAETQTAAYMQATGTSMAATQAASNQP